MTNALTIDDRKHFFDTVRPMFTGGLTQSQVDGMTTLLDTWEAWTPSHTDLAPNIRWLAYDLATAFHETGQKMQPISEIGQGRGHDYGMRDITTHQIYYGRGYVQLTWKANYQVQGARLGIDLEHQPDLALVPATAADIMFTGMATGCSPDAGSANTSEPTRSWTIRSMLAVSSMAWIVQH